MGKIKVLPKMVADMIAAGEVVERPASVVKELVENSLDAGSTRIEVEIGNAGRDLVRVSDDGEGMSAEDLQLACRRHATSKISTAADLEAIATLGFRGEALAGISAVSRVKIVSRRREEPEAWELKTEGGTGPEMKKTARAGGTAVEVANLFFNTPARLKFLRSNATEFSHVVRVVTELALAHPEIGFRLVHNGSEIFNLAAGGNLAGRVGVLLGGETAEGMIEFSSERALIRVSGMIGRPGFGQTHRNHQIFFVNRRAVVDRTISAALKQAYHTFLPDNLNPPAVLFLEMPSPTVDVNVHPAKREVRFRRPQDVYQALFGSIREVLAGGGGPPPLSPPALPEEPAAGTERSPGSGSLSAKGDYPAAPPVRELPDFFAREPAAAGPLEFSPPVAGKFLQARDTYLVASDREGIVIVDQHAGHERLLFDEYRKRFQNKTPERQRLAFPLTLNLSKATAVLAEEYRPVFHELGFDLEPFGKDTYAIQSYPAFLGKTDPVRVVEGTLEELSREETFPTGEERITRFLAVIACHSAVRAGDRLPPEQIAALLSRLESDHPLTCPHGRPVFFRITWSELEKRFRRK